ncbi:hypothetical protein CRG98_039294 [Punica granatum]|uniref:Uncharacterized protein n=1 Tax=Punica granatum TaxID=22663 RepID=A0A2I0IAC3_PUNGR|nr:hypothetical protein CRG98_039294 [Punica granatum]
MKLSKLAGATTSTALPHTMGSSTGASQFPRYPASFLDPHTSFEAPLTALPRTSTTRLLLCQPCSTRIQISDMLIRTHSKSVSASPNPYTSGKGSTRMIRGGQRGHQGRTPQFENRDSPRPYTMSSDDRLPKGIPRGLWSYADMPGLDPSIVKHFLPLDTQKFCPKRQQLRRQQASLLLRIKEKVVKQINAGFLEVCNYFEWVANIVPVEKKKSKGFEFVSTIETSIRLAPKTIFPCLTSTS